MGEAPEHIVLVETEADVDALEVDDPDQRRLHLADHAVGRRDARDHRPAARAVPAASPVRAPTTSATPRRTARRPSSRWPRSATSCSSSARRTRRTRSASSRSPASTAPSPTSSTTPARCEEAWLEGKRVVGISSGAQRPRGARGARSSRSSATAASSDVAEFEVVREDVRFMLPKSSARTSPPRPPPDRGRAGPLLADDGPALHRVPRSRVGSPTSTSARSTRRWSSRGSSPACRG